MYRRASLVWQNSGVHTQPSLTIERLRARAVNVPLRRQLQTAGGMVSTAPLVLIDLSTAEGVAGCSYLFCYTPLALKPIAELLNGLGQTLAGLNAAPVALERHLNGRFRLLGMQGFAAMAVAGIEMAAWDALGKASGLPLVRLMGGAARPIPAYNSCGLGLSGKDHASAEARDLLEPGFRALKVRLGYPDMELDVAVVQSIRKAVGQDVQLMADYNQSLSVPEAIRRIRRLDHEALVWVEEPVLAEDFEGHATVRREVRTPIQSGENWWGAREMGKALGAGACDFVMADAMKIGGVTRWMRAAAIANLHGAPLSSHLFPEISAHLLAVTPTAHWLEWVDFAAPVLLDPLEAEAGHVTAPDRPGIGIEWNEDAVARYLYA